MLFGSTIPTHHISFLCEDGIVKTFQGHPFVGQLHIGSVFLSEVASSIDVLSQTEVSQPDTPSRVQPIRMYYMSINRLHEAFNPGWNPD